VDAPEKTPVIDYEKKIREHAIRVGIDHDIAIFLYLRQQPSGSWRVEYIGPRRDDLDAFYNWVHAARLDLLPPIGFP
jgi:hypothetical protein